MAGDSRNLIRRLNNLKAKLELTPELVLREVADQVLDDIQTSAITNVAPIAETQVGFDFDQFMDNLSEQRFIKRGRGNAAASLISLRELGDVDDYEEISGVPGLWHYGLGQGRKFRNAIYRNIGRRLKVAQGRQEHWDPTTPQWWFFEYGNKGGAGGVRTPATHFIGNVTRRDRIQALIRERMKRLMRL